MIGSLHRGLNAAGKRQDLVVVVLLVTAILMMILPLPTWLVDVLIAVNLAGAVLLLMMGLYLKRPLEFSTLPSVILIVTIFRLALSITTTRLILLNADAGSIIETFGQFVIAGEIIVGLVVFLTAQLPALFVSLAAGSVITRVATDENENLGADITREMFSSVVALRVAAVILGVMMFIPGFPWFVFLFLAAGLMAISFSERLGVMMFGTAIDENEEGEGNTLLDTVGLDKSPFAIRINPDLISDEDRAIFADESAEATLGINAEIGLSILPPRLVMDSTLALGAVRVDLDDVVVNSFVIDPDAMAADAEVETLTLADVAYREAGNPPLGFRALKWVDPDAAQALGEHGVDVHTPFETLLIGARSAQQRFASQCIGVQEARAALVAMSQQYPDLASEVRDLLPLNKVAEVFRRLVDEGVPIRNQRLLLEALAEWGAKEQDPVVLTEYVRTALKRQICNALAGDDRVLPVYLLDAVVEDALRNAVRQTTVGEYLALDDNLSAALVEVIRDNLREPTEGGTPPCVLASLDVRRFVRSLMANNGMRETAVLSYQDLSTEFTITPITTIMLPELEYPSAAE